MRTVAALLAAALTLALAGCGGTDHRRPSDGLGPTVDLDDPRYALQLDDDVTILPLAARGGDRADYRVPARLLRGRHDAALVRAAMATIWTVMDPASRAQQRRLDADQRAVYALAWGGNELAFGGFQHMYDNPDAAFLVTHLAAAARHVGAPEPLVDLFAQAQAFRPNAQTAGDWTSLNARYAALQRRRATTLAHVLGAFIERHRASFATTA